MSGVLAVAAFDGRPLDAGLAETMAAAAPHRGAARSWSGDGVLVASLGDDGGLAADDDLVVAVDGRIDNVAELRVALGMAAHPSSAELILAAARRWGAESADHLLGDFVFITWDRRSSRLSISRDPMGSRNVYYRFEAGRRLLAASELKQLLAVPDVPCRLGEEAIIADLAGLYALPHMTAYEGIEQLPPGHVLSVRSGRRSVSRYWSPEAVPRIRHATERGYAEHFLDVFAKAVRARTSARLDGSTGIMLSGGIDSTSVLSTAAWLARGDGAEPSSMRAFTWAFDELTDGDERSVASPVAAHAGVALSEVPADDAWPLSGGADHAPDRDDPYSWPYQRLFDRTLATASSAGCAVLLTADRGDELMGNWIYDDLGVLLAGRWRALGQDLRAYRARSGGSAVQYAAARLARPMFTTLWPPGRADALRSRVRGANRRAQKPPPSWIPAAHTTTATEVMAASSKVPSLRGDARIQRYASVFDVISLRVAELRQRSCAAHGMVHADPWADRRLVEFALGVPQWRLQRTGREKYLARSAMRGIMPESARLKAARAVPLGLFRRAFNDREIETVRRLCATSRAAAHGWLDAGELLASYEAYLGGAAMQHDFWHPLTVELWLRRWWD